MSDITLNAASANPGGGAAQARPSRPPAPIAWARENLFSGWISTAVTLVLGYLIIRAVMGFVDWAFINAIWSVPVMPMRGADPGLPRPARHRRLLGGDHRKAPLHAVRHLSV